MFDTSTDRLSRRSVLTRFSAGAGILGLAGVSSARAALLPEPDSSESHDVVVIGSGLSGCAAALEAASRGASVVVLEKSSENRMGGNSFLAGGGFSVPVDASSAAKQAFVTDHENYCLGRGNSEIFNLMAEHVVENIAWLQSHGVEFKPPEPWPGTRAAITVLSPGWYAGMPNFFRRMRARIPELGGTFAFDIKAKQLIMNDLGAVSGVRGIGPGGVVEYRAKSVVIAAGGYAGNTQLLEAYSDPNAGAMMVRGIDWATGDGLMMAQEAGAGLKGMGGSMALHVAAVDPVETAAGNPFSALPYSLSINRDGKRFTDESKGYVAHGKAVAGQPGQSVTLVFDEAIKAMSGPASSFATFQRLGIKIAMAETLGDLAQQIGAPVEQFVQTIQEFNAAVKDGAALGASPPKAASAQRIETPPFYAFHPLSPGITLTFGGIMINGRAQALEADGRVIPGLFAAGEGAGHVFFEDYIGGGSMTNCLVMGRIAGREASS